MRAGRFLLALCAASLLAGAAHAREGTWYLAVGFGASTTELYESLVDVIGPTTSTVTRDERDPGFKLLVGYAFSPHWAVEGGFAQLGEFTITRDVTAPAAGAATASLRVKGWVIDLVGTAPLNRHFSVIGRVGVLLSEVRTFRAVSGPVTLEPGLPTSGISDEANFKVGVGLQYEVSPKVALRAEWEHFYRVGDPAVTGELDINLVGGGVVLRF